MNKWKERNGNKCNMCNSNKKPAPRRSLKRALNIEQMTAWNRLDRF